MFNQFSGIAVLGGAVFGAIFGYSVLGGVGGLLGFVLGAGGMAKFVVGGRYFR
jgi:hypothetical protein